MHNPVAIGEKLYLRKLEWSDLEGDYFNWLNDETVTRFLTYGVSPHTRERMEAYYRDVALSNDNILLAVIDKDSDKHIGNTRLGPIDRVKKTAPVGIMIGNREFWGKGYGAEAIRLTAEYAFRMLDLNEVTAGVTIINYGSLHAFQKAGFKIEGKTGEKFRLDGEYYDNYYLRKIRENSSTEHIKLHEVSG